MTPGAFPPALADSVEDGIIAGNVYAKYESRNPLARGLVDGFTRALTDLVERTGARQIHEVGCGEGHWATLLAARGLAVRGTDQSAPVIATATASARAAGLSIPFRAADLHHLDPDRDGAQLILCCEVLEHVPDPDRALAQLVRLARPHLILSVPWEPLWRVLNVARGRYLRDLGNTPGHLQHWSRRGFLDLVGRRARIVAIRRPVPWTMVWCRTD
jgi:SAM-dependent methyltransferase